jgi:hypothetical protein
MRFREDFGFGRKIILNRKGKPELGIGKAEIQDREFAPKISESCERNIKNDGRHPTT